MNRGLNWVGGGPFPERQPGGEWMGSIPTRAGESSWKASLPAPEAARCGWRVSTDPVRPYSRGRPGPRHPLERLSSCRRVQRPQGWEERWRELPPIPAPTAPAAHPARSIERRRVHHSVLCGEGSGVVPFCSWLPLSRLCADRRVGSGRLPSFF